MPEDSKSRDVKAEVSTGAATKATYEAPRIEAVMTPEELEREVLFAGVASVA